MAFRPDIGGSGSGGGFTLGPADNIFGTDSGTDLGSVTIAPDLTTAESTRDSYDTNNPGWKDSYLDKDLNIILYYQDNNNDYVQYQKNVGGTWVNNQNAIIAIKGEAGANGAALLFESETARDTFFSDADNRQLLVFDLPIQVSGENNTVSTQIWLGEADPTTYESKFWALASIRSGTGSFDLAGAHKMSSSGENIAWVNLGSRFVYHPLWQTYDLNAVGTHRDRYLNQDVVIQPIDTDQLTNPTWNETINQIADEDGYTTYWIEVNVDPSSILTNVNAEIAIDGTVYLNTSGITMTTGIYRFEYEPPPPNEPIGKSSAPVDFFTGQTLTISITSTDGDVVLLGDAVEGKPFQRLNVSLWKDYAVLTENTGLKASTTTSNDNSVALYSGTDGNEIKPSSTVTISESASTTDLVFTNPSVTGTSQVLFTANNGDEEGGILYNESTNTFSIEALSNFEIVQYLNGASFTLKTQSEPFVFEYAGISVNPFMTFSSTSNSNTSNIYFNNQTPEGLITAPQGDFCFVSTGTDNNNGLFVKQTGTSSSGWYQIGTGNVSGPGVSVNNALATWNGTDADELFSVDNVTLVDDGTDINFDFVNPSSSGSTLLSMKDSSGVDYINILFDETVPRVDATFGNLFISSTSTVDRIFSGNPSLYVQEHARFTDDNVNFDVYITAPTATGDARLTLYDDTESYGLQLELDQGFDRSNIQTVGVSDLFITQTNSTNELRLASAGGDAINIVSAGAGLQYVFSAEASGVNGAKIDFYTYAATPEGNIPANPGDVAYTSDGNMYVKRTGTATTTGWESVFSGGSGNVSGPGSSTDNALATWSGIDGDALNSVDNAVITDDGSALDLNLTTPASNGSAFLTVNDELGEAKAALGYTDLTGNSILGVGDFGVLSNPTQTDISSANSILNIDVEGGVTNFINLQGSTVGVNLLNPLDTETVTFSLANAVGSERLTLSYDELNTSTAITSAETLNIVSATTMDIRTTNVDSDVRIKDDIYFGTDGGTGLFCDIYAQNAGDTVGFKLFDNSGTQHGSFLYNDTTSTLSLSAINDNNFSISSNSAISGVATTGITWSAGTNATLSAISSATIEGAFINLSSTSGNENVAVFSFENSQAGVDVFAKTSNPNGVTSGDPGDIAVVSDGADSTIAINTGTTNGNTVWSDLRAGSILTWGDGSVGNTLTTRYLTPGYDQGQAPTTQVAYVVPRDGVMKNMHIVHNEPSVDTDDILYTVYVNGGSTNLSVLIPANQSVSTDITNQINVSAGDLILIEVTKTVVLDSPINIICSLEFV